MPKPVSLLCFCAVFCLLLAGCWDRRELNEIGITSATGIDWSDDKWIVSYQVVVPSGMWPGGGEGGSMSQSTVHVFSSEGRTLREAANKSTLELPRQLYFSHNNAIVIGEKAAEHGLSEVVELFLRSVESRETAIMVTTRERASDLLKLFVPLEKIPGDGINKIMAKEEQNSGFYSNVRIFDFARRLYSDCRAIGVPEINLKGRQDDEARKELSSIDTFKHTYNKAKLALTGQSVFKDGRLIGHLNLTESFGVSLLSADVKQSVVTIPCSMGSDALSAFQINKVKTKVTPHEVKDGFQMLVRVELSGELLESACELDLTSNEAVRKLERLIEQEIERFLDTGWSAMKRLNADLPGFGDKIHRKYPKDWSKLKENGGESLTKLTIDPQVRVSVIRIGLSKKPLKQDKSNVKG